MGETTAALPVAWPAARPPARRAYLEIGADPVAVPDSRRYTRNTVDMWTLGAIADDAELIASELVSNAVEASSALPFPARVGLYLAADPDRLTLLVWDASARAPVRRRHDDDATAGRGLEIIEALSDRWGWSAGERGKVVWALLELNGSDLARPGYRDVRQDLRL